MKAIRHVILPVILLLVLSVASVTQAVFVSGGIFGGLKAHTTDFAFSETQTLMSTSLDYIEAENITGLHSYLNSLSETQVKNLLGATVDAIQDPTLPSLQSEVDALSESIARTFLLDFYDLVAELQGSELPLIDLRSSLSSGLVGFINDLLSVNADDQITICHVPDGNPDNPQTITIKVRALNAHLHHTGDHTGACS